MPTVHQLIEDGEVTPRERVEREDLWFAIRWLEGYEGDLGDGDEENLERAATVACWLHREVDRRTRRINDRLRAQQAR